MNKAPLAGTLSRLPESGGSAGSIGESFTPDLFSGTGTYAVKLEVPDGVAAFQPALRLTYSTGLPNGPFGLGWRLEVPSIERSNPLGIPTFGGEDDLLLAGERLVRLSPERLRPEVDRTSQEVRTQGNGFVLLDGNGIRHELGVDDESRVSTAEGTVSWRLRRSLDPFENVLEFHYLADGSQRYLQGIEYAIYRIGFIYEDRPDVLEDRRSGSLIQTRLRLSRIEISCPSIQAAPFRTYRFSYLPKAESSLLTEIQGEGRRNASPQDELLTMPVLKMDYSVFDPARSRLMRLSTPDGSPPWAPLGTPGLTLYDLDGFGLPGVLQFDTADANYWENQIGAFAPPRPLSHVPASLDLARGDLIFADLLGTGAVDFLRAEDFGVSAYFDVPEGGLQSRRTPLEAPQVARDGDPEARLVDLNGTGKTAILHRGTGHWTAYLQDDGGRWTDVRRYPVASDPETGPTVSLSDPHVHFADTTGDGLLDLVWVGRNTVDVWPGFGNGRFGPRRRLPNAPDLGPFFEPTRVTLADITGSGRAGLVYWEWNSLLYALPRADGGFSDPVRVDGLPSAEISGVTVVDMLGTGTRGILISPDEGYWFLDLTHGEKPFLLTRIDNGIGLQTTLGYQPSTELALEARRAGHPWTGWLPFPVHTIAEIAEHDASSDRSFIRVLRHDDGHFDPRSRRFRGFGRVSVTESGDAAVPTVRTVSFFHQGSLLSTPEADRDDEDSKVGALLRTELWGPQGGPDDLTEALLQETDHVWEVRIAESAGNQRIRLPVERRRRTRLHDAAAAIEEIASDFDVDDNANVFRQSDRARGASGIDERTLTITYARPTGAHRIVHLPAERTERDASDRILRRERMYYDGAPFSGLPLGDVERGFLSRQEALTWTTELLAAAYPEGLPAGIPDLSVLDLHQDPDDIGWWATTARRQADGKGNVAAATNATGGTTLVEFDSGGLFAVATTSATGIRRTLEFDHLSQRLHSVVAPNGETTTYRYDALGRSRAAVREGDSDILPTHQWSYQTDTVPISTTREARIQSGAGTTHTSVTFYDGRGQVAQEQVLIDDQRVAVRQRVERGPRGLEVERFRPYFIDRVAFDREIRPDQQVRQIYDGTGRLIRVENAIGTLRLIEHRIGETVFRDLHDTAGSGAAAAHGLVARAIRHLRDGRGNLLAVEEPGVTGAPQRTQYFRDSAGRVESITDSRGQVLSRYRYDLLGRRVRLAHADAGIHRVAHNALGKVAAFQNANGATRNRFDPLGRLRSVEVDGSLVETFEYQDTNFGDLLDRLARATDALGDETFHYDTRGRVSTRTRTVNAAGGLRSYLLTYGYDAQDRLSLLDLPGHRRLRYQWDALNRLAAAPGIIDEADHDADGQIHRLRWANGIEMTRALEPVAFRREQISFQRTATREEVASLDITRDLQGNMLESSFSGLGPPFARSCTYDLMGRVSDVLGSLGVQAVAHRYRYDSVGNLSLFDEGNALFDPVTGPGNQIPSAHTGAPSTFPFTYDGCGNLTRVPDLTLRFDARGRLVQADRDDGTRIQFGYGHDGGRIYRRVEETDGSLREEITVAGQLVDQVGTGTRAYALYRGMRLGTIDESGTITFLHGDQLGSACLVSDANGRVVARAQYHAFGGLASLENGDALSPYRFLMKEFDDRTGLYYFGARYYHPRLGRFVSPDALIVGGPDDWLGVPAALNPYGYAMNNPLTLVDVNGNWLGWFIGGIVIAGAIVLTGGVGAAAAGAIVGGLAGILYTGYYTNWDWSKVEWGFAFGTIIGAGSGQAGFELGTLAGPELGGYVQVATIATGDAIVKDFGATLGNYHPNLWGDIAVNVLSAVALKGLFNVNGLALPVETPAIGSELIRPVPWAFGLSWLQNSSLQHRAVEFSARSLGDRSIPEAVVRFLTGDSGYPTQDDLPPIGDTSPGPRIVTTPGG